MILAADQLTSRYGRRTAIDGVSLRLKPGVTALLGPNAAGKSTLMKCLAGLRPAKGVVTLDGRELAEVGQTAWRRAVSYLPQEFTSKAAVTVFEAILLGRLGTLGLCVRAADVQAVNTLIAEFRLESLAGRRIGELSGGQAQLVAIAQSLAREPHVLLMDEPTSNLDLRRQHEVCETICSVTRQRDMTTAVALHDLNLAARYADEVIVLEQGCVRNAGSPRETLTTEMVEAVYGVRALTAADDKQRPLVTVLGLSD